MSYAFQNFKYIYTGVLKRDAFTPVNLLNTVSYFIVCVRNDESTFSFLIRLYFALSLALSFQSASFGGVYSRIFMIFIRCSNTADYWILLIMRRVIIDFHQQTLPYEYSPIDYTRSSLVRMMNLSQVISIETRATGRRERLFHFTIVLWKMCDD